MPNEIDGRRRMLKYSEARQQFEDPDLLLMLLKEGSVVAIGRHGYFTEEPGINPSPPEDIDCEIWRDWELEADKNTLRDDVHGFFFSEIEIPRENLEALENEPPSETTTANTGGRPANPLWNAFWVEVAVRVFNDGIPESTAAFAREAFDFELWQGNPPDLRTIEKRLEPLMNRLGGKT